MKAIYATILGGIVLATLTNCGKGSSSSSGANEMSTVCVTQSNGYSTTNSSCNNAVYASAGGFGPATAVMQTSAYGYGYGVASAPVLQIQCGSINSSNLYSIGVGYGAYAGMSGSTAAVYSPTKGAGCVYSGAMQMNGTPVPYNVEATAKFFVSGSYYSSGTPVYRVCDANEPCPSAQACRSPLGTTTSSAIGICYYN